VDLTVPELGSAQYISLEYVKDNFFCLILYIEQGERGEGAATGGNSNNLLPCFPSSVRLTP